MKCRFFSLVVSFLVICLSLCAAKKNVLDNNMLLLDGWRVQSSAKVQSSGVLVSTAKAKTEGWYGTNIPATVMGVLTGNGLYKDVLKSMNYRAVDKTLFDDSWWFRKEFELPALKTNEHVSLKFEGISYSANVWFNGQLIASRDSFYGTFRQHLLDITPYVKARNVLAVEVFRAQPGDPNIGFVDWNPRPADASMGIFREVSVNRTKEVELANTYVHSKVNTETLDEAWLTVETQLTNLSDKPVSGELSGTIEKGNFSVPVSLKPGEKRVVKITREQAECLYLHHPRLWWCNNLGTPEMYKLDLRFKIAGEVSDKKTVNFGVREIKDYFTKAGDRGFLLNGKKVLIRGAGWTDDIFLRDTPQTNEIQARYIKDMNLNSVRFEGVWGGSQKIYDLCDKYGLLVLVGWSCHWEWADYLGTPCDEFGGIKSEKDMNLITLSLRDQVLWLRNHPSIIAWYVGSDTTPRPELEKKYVACLSQIDDRPYVAAAKSLTSEVSGPTGMKMNGPYEYVGPNYWYVDSINGGAFGFNTETGIGAQLPVIESIKKMIPADKLWPLNEEWDYHCTASSSAMNSLKVLTDIIDRKYGQAQNLNDYLKKADLINYEATGAMFEAFRVNIPKTTGIVQWMLNSAWPSLYWQLYDYYLIPTAAYYSVKKANLPKQLIYDYKDNAVYFVNEGPMAVTMNGKISLYSLDSKLIQEKDLKLEAEPYTSTKVFELKPITDGNAFLSLQLMNERGVRQTDNVYCLSARQDEYDWEKTDWIHTPLKATADFTKLSTLPEVSYHVSVSTKEMSENRIIEVTVENACPCIGFFTRFALKDDKGEVLYPVFWEDNYITLLPGEKRVLKCTVPQSVIRGKKVTLFISGWNVTEKVVGIS
ncbi:sugar-binding domain-containing protein [uncultured Bacteroides sp.]|uniref:glycoside hydrolase family 2 protein n=1 Tax=uncultured Bacteroides sp. TaxID=162156 RepID=UPI002AA935FC|nr:sugar-binding domain-containing protein [uncultured Bacteroides sp.]